MSFIYVLESNSFGCFLTEKYVDINRSGLNVKCRICFRQDIWHYDQFNISFDNFKDVRSYVASITYCTFTNVFLIFLHIV